MSINVGQNSSVAAQSSSGAELLTAALAKGNQQLQGKMALQLIQSASPKQSQTYQHHQEIVGFR